MGESSKIATELRDEVLQTLIAVRLNLAHAAAYGDEAELRRQATEAQQHLATEARRLRELIDRLRVVADEFDVEDVAA
jgi:signal transduction histidine kinase